MYPPKAHLALLDSAADKDTEEAGHDQPEAEGEHREAGHLHLCQLVPELRNQLRLELLLRTESGGGGGGWGPPCGCLLSCGGDFRGWFGGGLAHWRLLWRL